MKIMKFIPALLMISSYALAQEGVGKLVGTLQSDSGLELRVIQNDVSAKDLDSATSYHLEFVSRVYTTKSAKKFRNVYLLTGAFTFEEMCDVVDQSGVSCAYLTQSLKNGTAKTWNDVLKPEVKASLENLGALGVAGLIFFGYPDPMARESIYDRLTHWAAKKQDNNPTTVDESEIRRLTEKAGATVSESGIRLTKNPMNVSVGEFLLQREEIK